MFKHMFTNANIMILFKIFRGEEIFDLEAALEVVKHWTQSRHLPHTRQFDF